MTVGVSAEPMSDDELAAFRAGYTEHDPYASWGTLTVERLLATIAVRDQKIAQLEEQLHRSATVCPKDGCMLWRGHSEPHATAEQVSEAMALLKKADTNDLRKRLEHLARERTLFWKHRKTSMIAKTISLQSLRGEELLLVRVDKVPTLTEKVPRSHMEKSFVLITEDEYKHAFNALKASEGLHYSVDLQSGKATRV